MSSHVGLPRKPQAVPNAVTADRLKAFISTAEATGIELHALIVHQAGEPLFENYWWPRAPGTLHAMHSSTKSFTGIAVGLAVEEGRLSLDARVVSFFPDFELGDNSTNLSLMTVRDLLTMRTGHEVTPSGAEWRLLNTSWTEAFLSAEVGRIPGEEFSYSSASAHMLSAIVQVAVGEPVSEYLRTRFFEPLGVNRYEWDLDPEGIASGGNGLSLTAPDFIKWGLVYLANGRWEGRQIVPEQWVRESTKAQVEAIADPAFDGRVYRPGTMFDPTRLAYGYQVWLGPQNSYYTLGLFGQICMVIPDRELVLLFNAATETKRLLPLVYDVLLGNGAEGDAAITFDSVHADLGPTRRPPELLTLPKRLAPRLYSPAKNSEELTSIGIEVLEGEARLLMVDRRGEHRIVAGVGHWRTSRTDMPTALLHHSYQDGDALIEAGARWMDGHTLSFELIFVETPFRDTITLCFEGDTLRWKHTVNVNSGPTALPEIIAHRRHCEG